ncbi:periplasmic nitrate reductase, NapE protein [Ferrovibrio sp.]|uniref:periplasmic nitrate reductase, NapE protein n=1 Tax=Ferrovibrio sp. TaxID=1917215 RepID=UPI001B7907C7|nr:periplasmic nitrate reductase, NapE protein [Ferrovibrio sp.]MBP7065042.1 periplasmic nitrate reductase, NapE protein [Ferrovibrio sp.]
MGTAQRDTATDTRRREWIVFLFLTGVIAPGLAVAIVGSYGFAVWMYQMIAGPPAG